MKGEEAMYDTMTLNQGLRRLKKRDLVIIGQNQGIDAPSTLKKEDLIMALNDLLPKKFAEEIIYFLPNELMVYSDGFRKMFDGLDHKQLEESLNKMQDDNLIPDLFGDMDEHSSMEDIFQSFDLMKDMVLDDESDSLNYLVNNGYAFLSEKDNTSTVKLPLELKDVFAKTMEERGDEVFDYQSLQVYIFSLTNLYGVCSYHQLHKVFKKLTGSPLTLKKVKDYVLAYSGKSRLYEVTDNYFYTNVLEYEEFETIVDSDLQRDYYFPTEEELSAYGYGFFGQKAIEIYNELRKGILTHSKIEDIVNEELVSYAEAMELEDGGILEAYETIFDEVMFYAKMGYGLYDFIKTLNRVFIKFDTLNDMNRAFSLYNELQEITRKWPLKGALYSEL